MKDSAFVDRYGPWALVLGASEGLGAAYAEAMASRGLDVVLVARRQAALDEVADGIRAATGRDVRTMALDLSGPDAMERLVEGTTGLDIGMVMYCAGADPRYEPFLAQPVAVATSMLHRNCALPLEVCHQFARPMQRRGRGGIVLVSSGAGLVGARNMVTYGATKAFTIVMAEALWAELNDQGVDVLGLVLGLTDTPALRRTLAMRGALPQDGAPIPGACSTAQTVAEAVANLSNGPTWFVGEAFREGAQQLGSMPRNDAVRILIHRGGQSMGP